MMSTDGLPQDYHNIVLNAQKMKELRTLVETTLSNLESSEQTAADVLDVTNICPIFLGEVEEMVEDWKEQRGGNYE